MNEESKQAVILNLNNYINNKIKRLQNLNELMRRAVERNIIIYDSLADPGSLSFRLYDLILSNNESIAYMHTLHNDPDLFYYINQYLINVLDCCDNVKNKRCLLLSVNHKDEPVLAIY